MMLKLIIYALTTVFRTTKNTVFLQWIATSAYFFKEYTSTAYYVAYEQLRQALSGFAKLDIELFNNLL